MLGFKIKMVASQHYTRIDTSELKERIYQKVGQQMADEYFNYLTQLLRSKLKRSEFATFCIRTIGRENLSLHNQLIRSIIKNASLSKVPPSKFRKVEGGAVNAKVASGNQKSCLQSLCGDGFLSSPRKGRSPINRDRKSRERPSPLGPLGKSPSITCEEGFQRVQEQQSATELISLGSRPPVEVVSVEDGEEVEQFTGSPGIQSRSPVTAPLGISMHVGGAARKSLSNGSLYRLNPQTCQSSCELPDTKLLRRRLEQKLEKEGFGISLDCANLLNNGLDVFLKRLIEPCIGLAASRHNQTMRGLTPGRYTQRQAKPINVSTLDFRVAMESNPRILGEDWSIQVEKIYAAEECTDI